MSEPANKPEAKDSSEFHETDFYSNFQDQEGSTSLPGGEDEIALTDQAEVSGLDGPGSVPTRVDMDEVEIQELMDDALREGAGIEPDEPANLDTSIRADWKSGPIKKEETATQTPAPPPRAEPPPTASTVSKVPPLPPLTRSTPTRGKVYGGRPKKGGKPRHRRLFSTRNLGLVGKVFALLVVLAGGAYAVFHYQKIRTTGVSAILTVASEAHAAGDFEKAIEAYGRIQSLPSSDGLDSQAGIAFLEAGAHEAAWRSGKSSKEVRINHFKKAFEKYTQAFQLDHSPTRFYAVEALLAKAEMASDVASRSDHPDPRLLEESVASLQNLVESPELANNPAVQLGIPHRKLADRLRESNPQLAIKLLETATENQGYLEEGIENLAIARIYEDMLDDPDEAEGYYEKVKHNELASETDREAAGEALDRLSKSSLDGSHLFGEEMLDGLEEMEVE